MDPTGVLKDDEMIELLMKAGLQDVLARYKENEEERKNEIYMGGVSKRDRESD